MKYSIRICVMCFLSGALGWPVAVVVIRLELAVPEKIKTRVERICRTTMRACEDHNN